MAAAGSGAMVVGAGLALGVTVADMAADWSARETPGTLASGPAATDPTATDGDAAPLPPRVVTRVVERHVTPEPVVVHRKVYRTSGGSDSRSTASTGTRRAPRTVSRPSRRVVAPAPAAPRPAPVRAPASTTSTSS